MEGLTIVMVPINQFEARAWVIESVNACESDGTPAGENALCTRGALRPS